MYRVIAYFIDLQDGEHPYNVGDAFPREGHTVSEERIAELSSFKNKRRMPLIEKVKVAPVQPEKAQKDLEAKPAEEIPEETMKKATKVAAGQKEAKSDRSRASGNAQSKSRKKK